MPSSSALLSGFVIAATLAMGAVVWATQGGTNEDGLLIAVFPPTMSERAIMETLARADGRFVRPSLPATIVIAHSQTPGFAERLKAHGAWLTYSSALFGAGLGGCMALSTIPYEPAAPLGTWMDASRAP
ncbi:MAG: hypothetical protein AAF590_00730 [Pseudomonadota bacterium]